MTWMSEGRRVSEGRAAITRTRTAVQANGVVDGEEGQAKGGADNKIGSVS